jgi:hypothetical protein
VTFAAFWTQKTRSAPIQMQKMQQMDPNPGLPELFHILIRKLAAAAIVGPAEIGCATLVLAHKV